MIHALAVSSISWSGNLPSRSLHSLKRRNPATMRLRAIKCPLYTVDMPELNPVPKASVPACHYRRDALANICYPRAANKQPKAYAVCLSYAAYAAPVRTAVRPGQGQDELSAAGCAYDFFSQLAIDLESQQTSSVIRFGD